MHLVLTLLKSHLLFVVVIAPLVALVIGIRVTEARAQRRSRPRTRVIKLEDRAGDDQLDDDIKLGHVWECECGAKSGYLGNVGTFDGAVALAERHVRSAHAWVDRAQ